MARRAKKMGVKGPKDLATNMDKYLYDKDFRWPVPIEYVGMPNSFGESGEPDELLEKYGMKARHIIEAVKRVIARKNKD